MRMDPEMSKGALDPGEMSSINYRANSIPTQHNESLQPVANMLLLNDNFNDETILKVSAPTSAIDEDMSTMLQERMRNTKRPTVATTAEFVSHENSNAQLPCAE